MARTCVTITRLEQIPGTGVWELYDDASWEGRARSFGQARGSVMYKFRVRAENHTFTGLYDIKEGNSPLPELYDAAIELKGRQFRCWVKGIPLSTTFYPYSLMDEFIIQIEGTRVRFFREGSVVEDAAL